MTTKFKLILGLILLLLGIIFAMQNSTVVEVRYLVWSVQMSQALVIFLTGMVGRSLGFSSAPRSRYRGNLETHSEAVRILGKNTHNVESTSNWNGTQKVMLECLRHRFGQSDNCPKRVCMVGSIRDLLISG